MPVSSNALKCLPACKNQLCDIRLTRTLKRVAMIQRMNMKVITSVAIMHENREISILYTQSVLTDCLSLPDI